MQAIFNSCLTNYPPDQTQTQYHNLNLKSPQPIKFKLVKSLNLLDPLLKLFALPRRKQKYIFPRKNLYRIDTQFNSIPFVYNSVMNPSQSILLIYCHGSGSTLNHVFQYCNSLAWKFNLATLAYDYSGDGQSKKEFVSFQSDLKCILAWAVKQGYDLRRIILCGFSLGSYSALCFKGQMPRILISPICGLTSYVQDSPKRFQGELFDNIGKALQIKARVWITHCTKQLIPIQHARSIESALLMSNDKEMIQFTEITQGFDHKSAPGFLFNEKGSNLLAKFILNVIKQSKSSYLDHDSKSLKSQLLEYAKQITIKNIYQLIQTELLKN